jgi:hypothetical protein
MWCCNVVENVDCWKSCCGNGRIWYYEWRLNYNCTLCANGEAAKYATPFPLCELIC